MIYGPAVRLNLDYVNGFAVRTRHCAQHDRVKGAGLGIGLGDFGDGFAGAFGRRSQMVFA